MPSHDVAPNIIGLHREPLVVLSHYSQPTVPLFNDLPVNYPTMADAHQSDQKGMTNYFVCTLGQAAAFNEKNPHPFKTINDFIDHQAQQYPNRPAIGFPVPERNAHDEWGQIIYTFQDLRLSSILVGQRLRKCGQLPSETEKTVALLCPSSVSFLLHWLALMRLGYSVLLIAPQCQPSAILHLCKECKVSMFFFDDTYADLARNACQRQGSIIPMQRLFDIGDGRSDEGSVAGNASSDANADQLWLVSESDVAYLHHTSGTSSGLPKPIPQTHRAAVGVLPTLDYGHDEANFTTTPLYHGGVADCFRAWTSGAMIWLFPGADIPITACNVMKSLQCARKATAEYQTPLITYFSSVPYVLQMMAADKEGLNALKGMDLVGVGGAALPQEAGDNLVAQDIKLLSRFGSAECGFLMSSHRNYAIDKEWQYLRSNGSPLLRFEPQEHGLAELVILPTWPHMAKRNREDGSYATADLFEPHSTIPNAWRYHSRADSQLTLITGKKFDPEPLEDAIANSPLLNEVLIFGNARQYPGALLFRSPSSVNMPNKDLLEVLWPSIEKLNAESQGHTRLSRSMLVVMPNNAPGLEKSSKGTVMRAQAEKKYVLEIDTAYNDEVAPLTNDKEPAVAAEVTDEGLSFIVLQIIKEVTNSQDRIEEEADLFSLGVDSVACIQIRALLQSRLLHHSSTQLPLNVVYDCGTIKQLSKYLNSIRKGQKVERKDEIQLMRDLVKEYGTFQDMTTELAKTSANGISGKNLTGEVIILTGATGALGAHLLALLRDSPKISQIHCLVRAASEYAAHERVFGSLRARRRETSSSGEDLSRKIFCHPCKLSDPLLGLPRKLYKGLADRATIIIHAAWAVNFSMRLPSFVKDHINGMCNLIGFALASPNAVSPRFIFCSSTASVLGPHTTTPLTEIISRDPLAASPLGYSRSKWVAEAICNAANQRSELRGKIAVLRIGQLCGDTQYGIWNSSEAWPLMLNSVKATGCLPQLEENLNWLPVDIAAEAVLEVALASKLYHPQDNESETPVYHILNCSTQTTWSDLLRWMHKLAPGFETITPADWVTRLENLEGKARVHPARKLIGLWREAYCNSVTESGGKVEISFAMEQTRKVAHSLRDEKPITEKQFGKLWAWIEQSDSQTSLD